MHVLIGHYTVIPARTYGGTERVMWWLGKALIRNGHNVTYLVKKGSSCPFASIINIDPSRSFSDQIPDDVDLVHLFFQPSGKIRTPYLVTNQGNIPDLKKEFPLDQNTVFVSRNHAQRHHSDCFVYNGVDFDDYGAVDINRNRIHYHFLAKGSWRAKNLAGAIDIASKAHEKLQVLGGNRFSFKRSPKYWFASGVAYHGLSDDSLKGNIMTRSKGLLFPVLWHEPFGIAIVESLYFGCPVFGTTFGSLPELITREVGFLSNSEAELITAISEMEFDTQTCQNYARDCFPVEKMTKNYLDLYEKVLSGEPLNKQPPTASSTTNEGPFEIAP